jgi:anaerobic nitric oxide reductase transcription regulator
VGAVRFRPDTFSALQSYEWPGNIRELENVIARAVLRASAGHLGEELVVVAPNHLGVELSTPDGSAGNRNGLAGQMAPAKPLRAALEDFQRDLIRTAVEHNDGNWAAAARQLGVNRSNLHKLSKRLGIKDCL